MSDDKDRLGGTHLLRGEGPAGDELVVPDAEVAGLGADQADVLRHLALIVYRDPVLAELGERRGCGDPRAHIVRIGVADARPPHPREPGFLGHLARHDTRALAQLEGVRADESVGHTMRYRFDTDGIHMKWGIIFRREVLLNYSRMRGTRGERAGDAGRSARHGAA